MIFSLMMVAAGAPPWVDEKEFPKPVQEKVLLSTARLLNTVTDKDGNTQVLEASAVRIGIFGHYTYYLTAAHAIENSSKLEIETFDPEEFPKKLVRFNRYEEFGIDPVRDLAVVRFHESGATAKLRIPETKDVKADLPLKVLTAGLSRGKTLELQVDTVQDLRRIHKNKFDKNSLLAWVAKEVPEKGRSGGPIVNANGDLLGICSGNDQKAGYYVHLHEIRAFLESNRQGHLLRAK